MTWSREADQNVLDKCFSLTSTTPVRGERNQSREAPQMAHPIMKTAHFNTNMSHSAFNVPSRHLIIASTRVGAKHEHICADIYQSGQETLIHT